MFAHFQLLELDGEPASLFHCTIDPRAVAGMIDLVDAGGVEIRTTDGSRWVVKGTLPEVKQELAMAQEELTRAAVQIAQS